MSDKFGMPMVDCRPAHEVIAELRQQLAISEQARMKADDLVLKQNAQLEQAHADIAGLHNQLEEPQINQDDYRLNKLELEQLRQQLASALAACKQKDNAFKEISGDCGTSITVLNRAWSICAKALAIQPDDSVLDTWCGQLRKQLTSRDAEVTLLRDELERIANMDDTYGEHVCCDSLIGNPHREWCNIWKTLSATEPKT